MGAADRIAETILRQGQIQAEGLQRSADIQARAQQNNAQIWSGALQGLGQLPLDIQKAKALDTENNIRKAQLAEHQKQQDDQFNANQIFQFTTRPDPDGTVKLDDEKLNAMMQKAQGANIDFETQSRMSNAFKQMNADGDTFRQQQLAHQVKVAQNVMSMVKPGEQLTPGVALAVLKLGQANGWATAADTEQFLGAVNQGHDPAQLFAAIIKNGQGPQKPITNETELALAATGGDPKAAIGILKPGQKPEAPKGITNETELELAAADPNHPQNAAAKAALAARPAKPEPKDTSAEMDAAYQRIVAKQAQGQPITAQEAADKKAYETRKLLGPEAAAANAADRAATAAAGTNSRLDRTQAFQEAQAGRKELTDKVEQPYLDAKEKAATLRSVIEAAKGGNMAAGNVQSLLATLGLVTMEGVKRINTTELESVQGAGSLLERIKGEIGGITAGKPLSPKIQQDLTQMATLLEQSARKKYEQGFKQITGRYGLKDEQILPSEVPTSAAPAGGVPTYQDYLKAKQGKP